MKKDSATKILLFGETDVSATDNISDRIKILIYENNGYYYYQIKKIANK